jgi:hypothetical protein
MNPKQTVTFVTAYYDIYNSQPNQRGIDWRITHFENLLNLGIQMCLFVEKKHLGRFMELEKKYSNLKLADPIEFDSLLICKLLENTTYNMPEKRNATKDTDKYLILMNSKSEFVNKAIEHDFYRTDYYAWVDFSIDYVFKNKDLTYKTIQALSQSYMLRPSFLLIPGCYEIMDYVSPQFLSNEIFWRYCGGFFIGSKDKIQEFCNVYENHFMEFVKETGNISWEVNIWCWFEYKKYIDISFYISDHNDRIMNIPYYCFVSPLSNTCVDFYEYPFYRCYEPSSASYIFHDNKHILNTRYVNYWYNGSGTMDINDKEGIIKSKNISCILDNSWNPTNFKEIHENLGIARQPCSFLGLEDIRLFEYNAKLCFIATSVEHSPYYYNSIIIGKYDYKKGECYDGRVIGSPFNRLEKNWIPIVKKQDNGKDTLFFVYSWYPLQIGRINEEDKLIIEHRFQIKDEFFKNIRGSSCFVEKEHTLVGVVHFSIDGSPRKYFHMLVALDKETFKPLYHSNCFFFSSIGIEYCMGFNIIDEHYLFWISQNDREPCLVKVPQSSTFYAFSF